MCYFSDCDQPGVNFCHTCKESFCSYHDTNHRDAVACYFADCHEEGKYKCSVCKGSFCSYHKNHRDAVKCSYILCNKEATITSIYCLQHLGIVSHKW